jgi:hypothetical protein
MMQTGGAGTGLRRTGELKTAMQGGQVYSTRRSAGAILARWISGVQERAWEPALELGKVAPCGLRLQGTTDKLGFLRLRLHELRFSRVDAAGAMQSSTS